MVDEEYIPIIYSSSIWGFMGLVAGVVILYTKFAWAKEAQRWREAEREMEEGDNYSRGGGGGGFVSPGSFSAIRRRSLLGGTLPLSAEEKRTRSAEVKFRKEQKDFELSRSSVERYLNQPHRNTESVNPAYLRSQQAKYATHAPILAHPREHLERQEVGVGENPFASSSRHLASTEPFQSIDRILQHGTTSTDLARPQDGSLSPPRRRGEGTSNLSSTTGGTYSVQEVMVHQPPMLKPTSFKLLTNPSPENRWRVLGGRHSSRVGMGDMQSNPEADHHGQTSSSPLDRGNHPLSTTGMTTTTSPPGEFKLYDQLDRSADSQLARGQSMADLKGNVLRMDQMRRIGLGGSSSAASPRNEPSPSRPQNHPGQGSAEPAAGEHNKPSLMILPSAAAKSSKQRNNNSTTGGVGGALSDSESETTSSINSSSGSILRGSSMSTSTAGRRVQFEDGRTPTLQPAVPLGVAQALPQQIRSTGTILSSPLSSSESNEGARLDGGGAAGHRRTVILSPPSSSIHADTTTSFLRVSGAGQQSPPPPPPPPAPSAMSLLLGPLTNAIQQDAATKKSASSSAVSPTRREAHHNKPKETTTTTHPADSTLLLSPDVSAISPLNLVGKQQQPTSSLPAAARGMQEEKKDEEGADSSDEGNQQLLAVVDSSSDDDSSRSQDSDRPFSRPTFNLGNNNPSKTGPSQPQIPILAEDEDDPFSLGLGGRGDLGSAPDRPAAPPKLPTKTKSNALPPPGANRKAPKTLNLSPSSPSRPMPAKKKLMGGVKVNPISPSGVAPPAPPAPASGKKKMPLRKQPPGKQIIGKKGGPSSPPPPKRPIAVKQPPKIDPEELQDL